MQREYELRSRKKTYLQTPGLTRKAVGTMGSIVGISPVCSPAPDLSGLFSGSLYEPPKCWPKTNRLPVTSLAKWVFWDQQRIAIRSLQPWQTICKSPHSKGGELLEKAVGRAVVNKEFRTFHWLSCCQERSGVFLFPVGCCHHHREWELPLLVSRLYLIDVFVY